MAKTMARISGSTVINVEWCSDYARETDSLKDPAGRSVGIGDIYDGGRFYRGGAELLTPLEEALARIAALEAENADQAAALETIYQGVSE